MGVLELTRQMGARRLAATGRCNRPTTKRTKPCSHAVFVSMMMMVQRFQLHAADNRRSFTRQPQPARVRGASAPDRPSRKVVCA